MLVIDRSTGDIHHRRVLDIGEYLDSGDLLCMNNSAVVPARLDGRRIDTGGRVQGIVLDSAIAPWTAMLKSNGTLRAGMIIEFTGPDGDSGRVTLVDRDGARWLISPEDDCQLSRIGHTPLPPYILKARSADGAEQDDHDDRRWYRTVYEDEAARGSVAAPTAGFHFTKPLLRDLESAGVDRAMVTLHVGAGTFAPISTDLVEEHPMHLESWSVQPPALEAILGTRAAGGRIVAVGTTSVRVLESLPEPLSSDSALAGQTDLLITPGWRFRHVDALLTNFHLPESTLLALVGALVGLDVLKKVYEEAVESGYRFYSYGDAMLIL